MPSCAYIIEVTRECVWEDAHYIHSLSLYVGKVYKYIRRLPV